jgi:hypothetical protein
LLASATTSQWWVGQRCSLAGATTSLRRDGQQCSLSGAPTVGGRAEGSRNTPSVQPLTRQSTVSGAVGAGQPAADRENVDRGLAGATTSRQLGGAVLACWRDDKSAAGRTTVLAHWRDDESAAGRTMVLACLCDDGVDGRADDVGRPLLTGATRVGDGANGSARSLARQRVSGGA